MSLFCKFLGFLETFKFDAKYLFNDFVLNFLEIFRFTLGIYFLIAF